MAELEIKDDATRDDVSAMVKEYMEERAELEGGEAGKADADQVTIGGEPVKWIPAFKDGQDTSKRTTAGDDNSAGDDAAAERKGDGGEDSDEVDSGSRKQDWLTDEVRAELPRWISDEDLSEFSSRDELDRALSLMDRAALKAGREAGEKGGGDDQESGVKSQRGQERGQDGKFVKQKKREEADGGDSSSKPFEIDLDLSEFDDGLQDKIKGALTGLRDHYESRMQALDERFAAIEEANEARQAAAIEAQFDAIVDSLGHADLFGQSGEETERQLEARRKLFDEHSVYMAGLKSLGREGRMDKASVARVLRMAFADHISKQEQKNLTKRVMKQSNMRMGIGAERPAEQPFKGPLTKHPEVMRLYKELKEARGED